jgi:AraC-like DNA-binding protein
VDDPRLSQASVPPVVLTGLLRLADEHGVDTERWFAGTGVDRVRVEEPRTLVSYRQAVTVVRRALGDLPAGPVGLLVGNRDPLLSWGMLGTAVRSAPTGADAIRVAMDYHQGSGTLVDHVVTRTAEATTVELVARSPEPDLEVFLTEESFGGIVVLTRVVFGRTVTPVSAHLAYPPPPWASAYSRLWQCPVTFDAERTVLTLPGGLDERRIPTANAAQFEAALEATRAMLGTDAVDDFVVTVEGVLRRSLRERRTAAQVADELGVSPRTLHRRLTRAGMTYGAVQDRVRRQEADALLTRTRRPVGAVAAELGYSDAREFRRAYRRWTGRTPTEAREQTRPTR